MQRYAPLRNKSTLTLFTATLVYVVCMSSSIGWGQERLRSDPRAQIPTPPNSLDEVVERFYPELEVVTFRDEFVAGAEQPHRVELLTEVGRCYVAVAVAPAEEDIDMRVDDAGRLAGIDQARDSYPRVSWCAEGRTARIEISALQRQVDVALVVLLDSNTSYVPAGELVGGDLNTRLLGFWARVAPRWLSLAPPATIAFKGPALVPTSLALSDEYCSLVLAVAIGEIDDVDLVIRDNDETIMGSFEVSPAASLLFCDEWRENYELVVGVRRGNGTVRLVVLYPPAAGMIEHASDRD